MTLSHAMEVHGVHPAAQKKVLRPKGAHGWIRRRTPASFQLFTRG
jgi:hypothetical protein